MFIVLQLLILFQIMYFLFNNQDVNKKMFLNPNNNNDNNWLISIAKKDNATACTIK